MRMVETPGAVHPFSCMKGTFSSSSREMTSAAGIRSILVHTDQMPLGTLSTESCRTR